VRDDVKPGDEIRWSLDSRSAFLFAEDGRRL
jgi:inositol-phosphate transport system ATP-binding protein